MKPELGETIGNLATHPATYGLGAALARYVMGDRKGGWRAFLGQLIISAFVAFAAAQYLADEAGVTAGKRGFYVCLAAFVAKDLLMALIALGAQFARDPLGLVHRLREALRGQPKEGDPPKEDPK
jgi:hypothetical protein